MKDNYSEMNVDMEQILFTKEYDELTAAERDEIKDFILSKEDFYLMKNTLVSVKNSFGIEEEIEPAVSSKEQLMKMFNDKNGKVIPLHRPFYLNPVFQIGVAAVLVLGIVFFYPKGDDTTENVAMVETEDDGRKDGKMEEDKNVAPSEEISSEEAESIDEMEVTAEETPVTLDDEYKAVTKESKPDNNLVLSQDGSESAKKKSVANGEGYFSSDRSNVSDKAPERELYTKAERISATEKDADDGVASSEDISVVANSGSTATNASTGFTLRANTVPVGDAKLAEETSGGKDKKKDENKYGRTNTAGGHYYQPAADVKVGVSLKDEPALSQFLFTAL